MKNLLKSLIVVWMLALVAWIGFKAFGTPYRYGLNRIPEYHVLYTDDDGNTADTVMTLPRGVGASFTRSGATTRYRESTQQWDLVSSGEVAIGSPLTGGNNGELPSAGDAEGAYLGDQETFHGLRNEDLTNAVWDTVGSPTVSCTDHGITAPDGSSTTCTITDDDGGAGSPEYICQTVSGLTAGDAYGVCVWVNELGSGLSGRVGIDCTSSANCDVNFTCNPSDQTTWRRCCNRDTAAGGTSVEYCISPTNITGDGLSDTGLTDTIVFWHPQLIEGPDSNPNKKVPPPGPDPATAGSSVTVNADALTYDVDTQGWDTGTACAWVWYWDNDNTQTKNVIGFDGTDDWRLAVGASDQIGWHTFDLADNASVVSATGTTTDNAWNFICATWANGEVDLYLNGSLDCGANGTACGTQDDTFTAGGAFGSNLFLGGTADTDLDDYLNGHVAYAAVWAGQRLSAQEIARVDDVTGNVGGFVYTPPDQMLRYADIVPPRPTWSRTFQGDDGLDREIPWADLFGRGPSERTLQLLGVAQ